MNRKMYFRKPGQIGPRVENNWANLMGRINLDQTSADKQFFITVDVDVVYSNVFLNILTVTILYVKGFSTKFGHLMEDRSLSAMGLEIHVI
jgi:hypothetical protein